MFWQLKKEMVYIVFFQEKLGYLKTKFKNKGKEK